MKKLKALIEKTPLPLIKGACVVMFVLIFAQLYHYFFSNYRLQSPVVIELRPPVVDKFQNVDATYSKVLRPQLQELDNEELEVLTPTPTPKAQSDASGVVTGPPEYVKEKIRQVFGDDADVAIAVALAENTSMGHDVWSYSGCCVGIFQIHTVHIDKFDGRPMEDVDANIEVAKMIYDAQGWGPWEAYTNGAYKKYL